jgi:hypothetical protein
MPALLCPAVQLAGVCWVRGLVFVVTEFMQGGSLLSRLADPQLRYYARHAEPRPAAPC